jgi:hypothetical protein
MERIAETFSLLRQLYHARKVLQRTTHTIFLKYKTPNPDFEMHNLQEQEYNNNV